MSSASAFPATFSSGAAAISAAIHAAPPHFGHAIVPPWPGWYSQRQSEQRMNVASSRDIDRLFPGCVSGLQTVARETVNRGVISAARGAGTP